MTDIEFYNKYLEGQTYYNSNGDTYQIIRYNVSNNVVETKLTIHWNSKEEHHGGYSISMIRDNIKLNRWKLSTKDERKHKLNKILK